MSEIKNGGLDQYGAGLFEQQQFGTAGVEVVKVRACYRMETLTNNGVTCFPHESNTYRRYTVFKRTKMFAGVVRVKVARRELKHDTELLLNSTVVVGEFEFRCLLQSINHTILTCAQKRTSSQLSLPHGTVN